MSDPASGTEKPREFQPINDPKAILGYLKEGVEILASTAIWTKNQEHLIQSYIRHLDPENRLIHTIIPGGFDLNPLNSILTQTPPVDFFFSLSLLSSNIFFKTVFKGSDKTDLKFELPKQIFKVQRREFVRSPIPGGVTLQIKFQNPNASQKQIIKKVHDLSGGGFSFMVTNEDVALYKPGHILKNIELTLNHMHIKAEAEIRYIGKPSLASDTAPPEMKVGLKFTQLSNNDREGIIFHVFEESRKYYSKFL